MTYNTRQEVLMAAADWMDVCEKAGVEAICKIDGIMHYLSDVAFGSHPSYYEFPIALLEGKEVWVGDKAYYGECGLQTYITDKLHPEWWSWNQPKPKTVMIELDVEDAEKMSRDANERLAGTYAYDRVGLACKNALENLK